MTNELRIQAFSFALLAGWCLTLSADAQNKTPPRSPISRLEAVVARRLAADKTYAPGDLISRADVEPIINELLEMGLEPANSEELYDAILPENDRLVRLLKTPSGLKFMRQVSALPGVYDRLERLSWTEAGRSLLNDLVARPDGPKLLQSMTTPSGAKAVEQALGKDSRAKNFLLPTGHVHTAAQLLVHLKQMVGNQPARNAN